MPQSFSLTCPSQHYADETGTTDDTISITKLNSAKSADILPQMQTKCAGLVSYLFCQPAALYFHTASAVTNICRDVCNLPLAKGIFFEGLTRLALHSEGNNSGSAWEQTIISINILQDFRHKLNI